MPRKVRPYEHRVRTSSPPGFPHLAVERILMSRYLGVPARVLLLIAALSIVPAVAHADYIYTVTQTLPSPDFTTQFSFVQPTLASAGTVTSGLTQISGATATEFCGELRRGRSLSTLSVLPVLE